MLLKDGLGGNAVLQDRHSRLVSGQAEDRDSGRRGASATREDMQWRRYAPSISNVRSQSLRGQTTCEFETACVLAEGAGRGLSRQRLCAAASVAHLRLKLRSLSAGEHSVARLRGNAAEFVSVSEVRL